MNDVKRTSPPTPSPPPSVKLKRPKMEHPVPLTAIHGVERIPFSPSQNPNRLSSHYLARITTERTDILRGQGRHVVGLPVVLNDGIVLNWICDEPGSVCAVRSREIDDLGRPSATWFAAHRDEKRCLSVVSTGGGSGTSAADAIVINSDDEDVRQASGTGATHAIVIEADNQGMSGVLSLSDTPRELPIDRGISSDKDVINFLDSDIELLSSLHPENRAEHVPEGPYHSPLPSPADNSDLVVSDSPTRRTPSSDEDAVTVPGLCSYAVTSDSEDDATDQQVNDVDIESRSMSSLQPMRELLGRGKPRGNPGDDLLRQMTFIAPGVSKMQGREGPLEEAPAITSSESEVEGGRPASDPQLKRVPLPKTDHGRARRLLMPESADLPFVAVTMRGDCHFIERKKKFRMSGYSLPNPGVFRHVGDACIVGNTAVLGCDKGAHQISFLSVTGRPQMIDVTWSPHSSGPRYQDMQKRGVSRLAAVHAEDGHIKFLSGGYDGTIHEWTADIETLNEPCSRKVVSHGASIMALAYRDRDRSVMASAQRKLHTTDLNRCKTMTHPVSNDIQQIHIHPQAAYVTMLEVRHLDRQIQLYDSRKGGFDGEPCLSFGRRNRNGKFSGHTRGSVHLVHFAMASEDGGVLLWDFRNSKRAVMERRFRQAEKVVHTIFADGDVATFGQGVVTFFEDYLAQ